MQLLLLTDDPRRVVQLQHHWLAEDSMQARQQYTYCIYTCCYCLVCIAMRFETGT
jgi:hypothetical protein